MFSLLSSTKGIEMKNLDALFFVLGNPSTISCKQKINKKLTYGQKNDIIKLTGGRKESI